MGLDNPIHIAFLLILLLLVFGAKRLPEMGKSLGTGMRGFRDSLSGDDHSTPKVQPATSVAATTTFVQGAESEDALASAAPIPVAVPVAAPVLASVGDSSAPAA